MNVRLTLVQYFKQIRWNFPKIINNFSFVFLKGYETRLCIYHILEDIYLTLHKHFNTKQSKVFQVS